MRINNFGFMMIEVIASIVLIILLLSFFIPFIYQIMTFWNNGKNEINKTDLFTTAIIRITNDFLTAYPFIEINNDKSQNLFFYGDSTKMLFIRILTEGQEHQQLEEVGYEIINTEQKLSLVRTRIILTELTPTLPTKDISELKDHVVLLKNKSHIKFNYINNNQEELEEWNPDQNLPKKIIITINDEFYKKNRKLSFCILSDSPANCLISSQCQQAMKNK